MEMKDLMVGDWVMPLRESIGGPCRIEAIGVYNKCTLQRWNYNGDVLCRDIKPIPLTPEILEKNGFVYNESPLVQSWEQFGLSLYLGGDGYRINCGQNVAMVIDSVHQLQHALKLCGIEKEIKV